MSSVSVSVSASPPAYAVELPDENELNEMNAAISHSTAKKYKVLTKVAIYACELLRQISALSAGIIGVVAGAAAACFGSVVTATVLVFTGLMTTGVAALQHSDLWKDVKLKVGKEQAAKDKITSDKIANRTASTELKDALEEAQKASTIANLGFMNNCLFFGMGIGRLTTCVVTILECLERVAHIVVFSAGATTAFVALHAVASVVYFARGACLAYHAEKNLTLINEFEKEWNALTTIDDKIEFLKRAEALGQDYMDLRLDRKCLGVMTASTDLTDKMKFVRLVDKAIFSQKLKHQIGKASGALMIVGSILAAATLCVATGGTAFFVLGAISALFFAVAEVHFIMYYHAALFEKVRDKLYALKVEVQEKTVVRSVKVQPVGPIDALDSPKEKKPRETWCPNLGSFVKPIYDRLGWVFTKSSGAVRPEKIAS